MTSPRTIGSTLRTPIAVSPSLDVGDIELPRIVTEVTPQAGAVDSAAAIATNAAQCGRRLKTLEDMPPRSMQRSELIFHPAVWGTGRSIHHAAGIDDAARRGDEAHLAVVHVDASDTKPANPFGRRGLKCRRHQCLRARFERALAERKAQSE